MIQVRSIVPPPPKAPANPAVLPALFGVFIAVALVVGFALRVNPEGFLTGGCGQRPSNERNASTSLKTIVSAEYDFHSADRDWNTVKDFWRKDVAGLYAFYAAADPSKTPIKLIELSVAAADDRPVCDMAPYAVKSTKAGYWYRAILHEDEQTPSPSRFAYCAFPDTPSAGKYTFIVDEENVIYRKPLKDQRGVERFPKDPAADGWVKLD